VKSSKKTVSIQNLVVDLDLNIRNRSNYDLPTMKGQIKDLGRIVKPILVKDHQTDKSKYIVLSGNRRALSGQELYSEPGITVELKAALDKVDIIHFTDLTPTEELSLIIDHGSEKPISRSEIVQAVQRLDKGFHSESQIINLLYFALAKFSGNEKKLQDVPKDEPARSQFLKKWFHGTVGNFILSASRMGSYVNNQFLLTHLSEDKLLAEGQVVEMRCSRERITALSAAMNGDKKAAKDAGKPESEGWTYDKGGASFNALIEKFKEEDRTGSRPKAPDRPSVKELSEKADQFKCSAIKAALLVAAGQTEMGKGLVEADELFYHLDLKLEVLRKAAGKIKHAEVRELVNCILSGVPGSVEAALKPFVS
jgi:hypothetical protein